VIAALCHDPLPVGAVALAVTLGTVVLLELPLSTPLLVAATSGTALAYGADRALFRAPEDVFNRPDRVRWVVSHRTWLHVELTALALMGGSALLFLRLETLLMTAALATLALLTLSGNSIGIPIERTGIGKPLLIAAAWAVGAVGLPVLEGGGARGVAEVTLVGYRWLFIVPNLVLADWGDRRGDEVAGLFSWASPYEKEVVQRIASWALGGAVLLGGLGVVYGLPAGLMAADAAGLGAMGIAVWSVDPTNSFHRVGLDLLVGWPLITAGVAWLL